MPRTRLGRAAIAAAVVLLAAACTGQDRGGTASGGAGGGAGSGGRGAGARDATLDGGGATGTSSDAATVRFENLRVEEVTARRAVVRFETSVPTTCEVEFGSSAGAPDRSATDPTMMDGGAYSLTHEVPLEDLTPGTRYYYRARATTPADETFRSDEQSFDTLSEEAGMPKQDIAVVGGQVMIVEVSSNFAGASNDGAWGADSAFDGSAQTEWASDGDGDDAFITIDLGRTVAVDGLAFRSRKMADGSSIIQSYRVLVDDGVVLGPYDTPDPDQRYEVALDAPVSGRRFRFEAESTTGGNTGVKEIEIFAAPAR